MAEFIPQPLRGEIGFSLFPREKEDCGSLLLCLQDGLGSA